VLQLAEDRRLPISLKIYLLSVGTARYELGTSKQLQLTLNGSRRGACLAGKLSQIEALVGVPVKPRQQSTPRLSKKQHARVRGIIHSR